MSRRSATIPETTGDLAAALAFLGLDADATPDEIASAHEDLVGYLSGAPEPLWGWANGQVELADRALETLTRPTARRSPGALSGSTVRSADSLDGPATPPARRALSADAAATDEDEVDFETLLAEVTPSAHRDSLPSGRAAAPAHPKKGKAQQPARRAAVVPAEPLRTRIPRAAIVGALLIAAVVVGGIVYKLGDTGGGTAVASATPAASGGGLDMAAVAADMAKLQADPKDKAALIDLGNLYFQAQDFKQAADWFQKVVDLDPKNTQALLALGAAQFNQGDSASAKANWSKVVELDPKNVEAHYDLGFLAFNATPQDVATVKQEWGEVISLSPESDIATIVQAHLASLDGSPAPSAGASAAPAATPGASK